MKNRVFKLLVVWVEEDEHGNKARFEKIEKCKAVCEHDARRMLLYHHLKRGDQVVLISGNYEA